MPSRDQSAGANGTIESKRVLRAYHLRVDHTVLLTLSSGEVLETTENHPFFVYGAGWVKAGKLSIGNLLVPRAGPTASAVTVTGIARKAGPTTVYNFTVEDDHSYFVGTSEGGTWVHNGCTEIANDIIEKLGDGEIWHATGKLLGGWFSMSGPNGGYYQFHDVVSIGGQIIDRFTFGNDNPVPIETWKSAFDQLVCGNGTEFDRYFHFLPGSGE